MARRRDVHLALTCGLAAVAFALRVTSLDAQSMWRDEVDALRFATAPWPELANTFRQPGFNGPLYFAMLRGWIALAGESPFALRYFSLLAGVWAVPLMYVLGRRLQEPGGRDNRPALGWLAALGTACSPYFIWYSQEAKMYALVLALAILAIYALRRALQGRAGWWVVQVIATSLCVYLHILAALLIPLEFILIVIWRPRSWRKWLEALAALACLTLPYLPLLYWQLPLVLTPAQTGYPSYSLPDMVCTLAYGFSAGVAGHRWGIGLATPLFLLAGLGAVWGPTRWQNKLALAAWIVLPVLALYAVSLRRAIFTDRYLIWIGPAVYVLAGLGVLAGWPRARLFTVIAAGLSLLVFGWGIVTQATYPIKSDLRAAARFVEPRAGPDDLFIFQIPYIRYTFDYYYERPFEWVDGLYTNYGLSADEVDAHMRALIGARRVVWLVASEMTMWDQKLQVLDWLETHARRTEAGQFMLVDVYRYEMP